MVCFDEERALGAEGNVARFRNALRDMHDSAFFWVQDKRRKKDVEKPWLDDAGLKELVREKEGLYSRKLRGILDREGAERLDALTREINATRQRLKRAYNTMYLIYAGPT